MSVSLELLALPASLGLMLSVFGQFRGDCSFYSDENAKTSSRFGCTLKVSKPRHNVSLTLQHLAGFGFLHLGVCHLGGKEGLCVQAVGGEYPLSGSGQCVCR